MDTEFPGVVARPIGEFRTTADYQYQLLRCNILMSIKTLNKKYFHSLNIKFKNSIIIVAASASLQHLHVLKCIYQSKKINVSST